MTIEETIVADELLQLIRDEKFIDNKLIRVEAYKEFLLACEVRCSLPFVAEPLDIKESIL